MIGQIITPDQLTQPRCLRGRLYRFFSETTAYDSDAVLPQLDKKTRDQEFARTMQAIKSEREYLGQQKLQPYETYQDLLIALETGELVQLPESGGSRPRFFYQDRYRNEIKDESRASLPYLRPKAMSLLDELAYDIDLRIKETRSDWIEANGVNNFRLSVSSMTRSAGYQKYLNEQKSLASEPGGSVHNFGLGFDITNFGYFVELADMTGRTPDAFTKAIAVNMIRNSDLYNEDIIDDIQDVLESYLAKGRLHYINELPFACGAFHVAVKF